MIDARAYVTNPDGNAGNIPPSRRIGLAVHHSVSGQKIGEDATEAIELAHIRVIDQYHVSINFGGFGYHACVFPSGRAYQCGDLDSQRAHVAGRNHELLGVVLIGDFSDHLPGAKQQAGLGVVLNEFTAYLGREVPIKGHTDWALAGEPSGCPKRVTELDFEGLMQAPSTGGIADMKWATWADRPESKTFRTYLIWATADGLASRFVPNYEEHQALEESGVAGPLLPVSIETLRQFGCSPDPAS